MHTACLAETPIQETGWTIFVEQLYLGKVTIGLGYQVGVRFFFSR